MAVAAEVLLLVALVSSVHAEVIREAGGGYHFTLEKAADFCLITRRTGQEEELLWNSSVLHGSGLRGKASYWIPSLEASDSGQYQERCWTKGHVTHERNSTLLVCDQHQRRDQEFFLRAGETVELTCDGAGPNRSVQWFVGYVIRKTENTKVTLIDDETSAVCKAQRVKNTSSLLVTVDRPLGSISFYCVERSRHSCSVHNQYTVHIQPVLIHRSVGEGLELRCSDIRGRLPRVWKKETSAAVAEVSRDSTLAFPSLALNHTGRYTCEHSDLYREEYLLYVCPEPAPPAVVFFAGGETITLQCGDWRQTGEIQWFMRSNRTEGRAAHVIYYDQKDKKYRTEMSLVIADVSLEDSGEFWCVILESDLCVFTSKTLVRFREPEVDHHLVRSVLVSAVIMVMCVLIVAVVWSTRSREQLPVPVEEVQMSDLSPASADLPGETPV